VTSGGPLAGVRVVEVAVGVSDLGLGLAGGVPGRVLADLGAAVTRVVGTAPVALDADVPWGHVWHRDKQVVATDDGDEIRALLADADVALVYGPEALVEGRGLGADEACADHPTLVYVRCGPSRTAAGEAADFGLLVEAQAGFCTQLDGHRPGPIFVDVRASGAGTSFLVLASALALLGRRAETGAGGWAETSLYDGMLATLGCMIGRSERAPEPVEGYWREGSTFPNFLYRCADGELIQVWFGGKGMYAKLLEVLGDEPSVEGYYADQTAGRLGDRARRWRSFFATRPRDAWIERLRAVGVACEPVFAPGEALADPHLAAIGLAVRRQVDGHEEVVLGAPVAVTPLALAASAPTSEDVGTRAEAAGPDAAADAEASVDRGALAGTVGVAAAAVGGATATAVAGRGPLDGVKVLDFSAFVAGPLGAQVLADLGAEVIKVEPPGGEAMRAAAYAVAACQRGKRSLAMDINAPESRPVVDALIRWADVVLHNFRVGVSERLGIDEATVARLNPGAVYCHASAFGTTGPRAMLPGNDALMQAVTGFERAVGGAGNDPIAGTWIPLDMAGGWVAAIGMLAGLYARRTSGGTGQQVATSLLGAGMLLQSGVHMRDGALVHGPQLDGGQTGYGPGYRIYEAGDGAWFAAVIPHDAAWSALAALPEVDGLPETYVPVRGGAQDEDARTADAVLTAAFATAPVAEWVERLPRLGVLVEPIGAVDRDQFRRGILDDTVNRALHRSVAYATDDWGHFEQIGPLLRLGPAAGAGPDLELPGIGEHSVAVLAGLGLVEDEIDALLAAGVVRQLGSGR
jgi:crotonobetainyl-CoA:carnitine CoA-transferase CaiB-like acyl-CoA transferase